jgi:hypothetical protein
MCSILGQALLFENTYSLFVKATLLTTSLGERATLLPL